MGDVGRGHVQTPLNDSFLCTIICQQDDDSLEVLEDPFHLVDREIRVVQRALDDLIIGTFVHR